MEHLFTLNYWFNLRPEALSPLADKLFLGLLALFALGIILIFLTRKKTGRWRGFLKKISNFCVGNIIIGAILYFINSESIPFFSARFWLAIWGLIMLVWLYFIITNLKQIKSSQEIDTKAEEIKKYLP